MNRIFIMLGAIFFLGHSSVWGAFMSGDNARTLMHDGKMRNYNVHAPTGYNSANTVPLVVDLHGDTSNAAQQRIISGWDDLADTEGFLVAYPDGIGNSWNAEICCGDALSNDEDDVGFLLAMVAAIQSEANINSSAIYLTGLSNGGGMTQVMACEAASTFAGFAPMAFPFPYFVPSNCSPSVEKPMLIFMGLSDSVVPYSNAATVFSQWRSKNSCGPEATETLDQYGDSSCDIDESCAGNVEVGLCSITGSDTFAGHVLYFNDDNVDLAQIAWDFFQPSTTTAPDLITESPSVSESNPEPLESITLSATVRNQGDGSAATTTLRYYRSADNVIDGGDTLVGTDNVMALDPGATSPEQIPVTVPVTPDTYFYYACVDDVASESNSANQCSSVVQVTVGTVNEVEDEQICIAIKNVLDEVSVVCI